MSEVATREVAPSEAPMKKSLVILATSALVLSTTMGSEAHARGLRIGIGIGLAVGVPLAVYGASRIARGESVVNGRYRCCSERRIEESRSRPAPRVRKEDRDEAPEKKVARKKPAATEETRTAVARAQKSKPEKPRPESKIAQVPDSAASEPARNPQVRTADASLAAKFVSAASPPSAGSETSRGSDGSDGLGAADRQSGVPQADAASGSRKTAGAEGQLNCRKFVPSIGQAIAVSCFD